LKQDDQTPAAGNPDPAAEASRRVTARRNERLALLALAGMAFGWGYNWVVMKSVLAYVGPFDFSALRTLFGALVLLAVLAVLRRPMRVRAWPRVALLGVLQTGAFSALIQVALLHGGAGKTSILVYTMPFWVIPMAWVAFGERVRGLQWLALALAAAGLVLILEPWTLHADFVSELLAVSAGLCWALSTIVAKWIKRDHPMDALPLTAWQMLFGAASLCLAAWLVPEKPIDPVPYFYGALFYNAVIATALAWFLWLFALQHLSAGVASMSALGVPVVGVLAGWLQLGEQPGALELTGMVMIAVALVVISLRSGK
jgi:drug/metabolite transporter (DMT)-like permease